jgi:surfactin synthase thioesterase subunit
MDLYLLPGLGADGRLFGKLGLPGHTTHPFSWPRMPEGSTLRDHARALAGPVDATKPHALIGVSMGGMVALEMAAITRPLGTILISSWKGPQEMPLSIRMLRGTHPERLLTPAAFKRLLPVVRWQMGLETPEDHALFEAFVACSPLDRLRVQIAAVLGWEGPSAMPTHLVHIHGDADRLMPIANIRDPVVVQGGGHFMVYNRAEMVSHVVMKALGRWADRCHQ